jgi:hypothetical protein
MPFRSAVNQNYHQLQAESDIIVAQAFAQVAGRRRGRERTKKTLDRLSYFV